MIALLKYIRSLELIDYIYLLTGKSRFSINPKLEKLPKNILFICTGNICRSSYAERKLNQLFRNPNVKVSSAGLVTDEGKQADPQAIEIALKRKINLSSHRTQSVTAELLAAADLILVMDSSHYKKINPSLSNKVKYLGCYGEHKRISIKDPFSRSNKIFENCFNQIDQALQGLKAELKMHSNFKIEDSKVTTMIIDKRLLD